MISGEVKKTLWAAADKLRSNMDAADRDRSGEVLFIDARKLGRLETRVFRVFDDDEIALIANVYHAWSQDGETKERYADVPGFCRAAKLEGIKQHDYVLTPGRYVGAEDAEEDDEAFSEKMERLTAELAGRFAESSRLEDEIRKNLSKIGYELPSS